MISLSAFPPVEEVEQDDLVESVRTSTQPAPPSCYSITIFTQRWKANKSKINSADSVKWSVERLNIAKNAGRGVFVVDYAGNRSAAETSVRRINELGYVPYIGPKALDTLWLPGRNF